jgi:hypothetical protein
MDQSTLHALRQHDHIKLQTLLVALNGARNSLRRDACGDWMIEGSRGQIRPCNDQFSIYLACHSIRAWNAAKKQLAGITTVSQDGDEEGILTMTRTPEPREGVILRDYIGLRQTRDAPQGNPFQKKF